MFENWVGDQNDAIELSKSNAYIIGSFINPEAVKAMLDPEKDVRTSSDEDFEEALKIVRDGLDEKPISRRKRRKLKV